jgi:hypothetical protein
MSKRFTKYVDKTENSNTLTYTRILLLILQ